MLWRLKMKWIVAFAVAILFASALNGRVLSAEPRLNVLFIAADDLGNVLGNDDPHPVATPNLDRLAAAGTRFERAYCAVPLCNPSRASLLTGLRPDVTSVFDLGRHFRKQLPDVQTLPQCFRQNGWRTARVGKIFHYGVPGDIGTNGLDDAPSWDEVVNPKGRDRTDERLVTNAMPDRSLGRALSWLAAEGTDEEQTDGMIATEAIRLLEENRDRPFFLGVGFFRPHTPYVAPRAYFERYPLQDVRLTTVPPGDRDDIPLAAFPHNCTTADYGLPPETLRQAKQAYYASATFMDAQLGRVLDALDRLGLAGRTIVVFWSDHGYHLGEHGLWQKRSLFEESASAPMIIRWPSAEARGKVCRRVVEYVDLYPTLADLAGITPPRDLAGRSLRPLLDDPAREWSFPAFTQVLRPGDGKPVMGRVVSTERWRYIEWNGGEQGRELYDLRNDPQEIDNVVERPEHAELIRGLRKQLDEHVRGLPPETPFEPEQL